MKRSHSQLPCAGIQRSHAAASMPPPALIRTETSGVVGPVPPPVLLDVLFHALRSVGVLEEELSDVLTAALALLVLGTLPEDVVTRVDPSAVEHSADMD